MEFSENTEQEQSQKGAELIQSVAALTGLPEPLMEQELVEIVARSGHSPNELTLDQLRQSMLAYLEELERLENEALLQAAQDTIASQSSAQVSPLFVHE